MKFFKVWTILKFSISNFSQYYLIWCVACSSRFIYLSLFLIDIDHHLRFIFSPLWVSYFSFAHNRDWFHMKDMTIGIIQKKNNLLSIFHDKLKPNQILIIIFSALLLYQASNSKGTKPKPHALFPSVPSSSSSTSTSSIYSSSTSI